MDIIPERNWGDIIGAGLGNALQSGLSNLATYKLRRIMGAEATEGQPQQTSQARASNLPIQPQTFQTSQATPIQGGPIQQNPRQNPQTLQALNAFDQYGRNAQGMTNPMAMVNQTLAGQMGMQQNPYGPSQGMMQQQGAKDLRQMSVPQRPTPLAPQGEQAIQPQQAQPPVQQAQMPQVSQQAPQQQMPYFNMSTVAGRQAAANWNKTQMAERKFEQAKREYENTANKEVVSSLRANAKTAKENIKHYETISQLAATGNLTGPKWQSVKDKLGIPNWFMNTETQLAQAEMSALAQGAAAAFDTSRLTNLDVELFRKSLVSLKNTPEAIQAISQIRILQEQAAIVKDKAREQIMKANGGYAPIDLEDRINDMVDPQLNKLAEQARQVVAKVAEQSYLSDGGSFPTGHIFNNLPNPQDLPQGTKIGGDNGEIYINGPKGWVTTYKGA